MSKAAYYRQLSQIAFGFYIALLIPPCFEIALRILGYQPFHQVEYQIEAFPEHCIIPHPTLGFALNPGDYEVIINRGLHYFVRHGSDSLRVSTYDNIGQIQDSVYFFGCSYTYGMGLSDSLTFPFLVGKNLPASRVKNFGVPGYGTVQTYLQLRELMESGEIPGTVIINYADFHDDRNSLTPAYRRDLFLGYQRSDRSVSSVMRESRIPYLVEDQDTCRIHFCAWEDLYDNWRYRETFAAVNFFQEWSDQSRIRAIDAAGNTRYVFARIRELCHQYHIRLIVTGITASEKTSSMLNDLAGSGIETLDISVDLALEKYRNAPYDDHPNELANAIFADKITAYLLH